MLKRTPLKKGTSTLKRGPLKKASKKKMSKILDMVGDIHLMHDFFMSIWNGREHKSEVSGSPIYGEPLTIYFHHILPKSKYKEASLDPDNIIILTFEEHNSVELNPNIFKEVNKRRELLLLKYNHF
jgi:hypothetical protein